jgi:hypothetical protein
MSIMSARAGIAVIARIASPAPISCRILAPFSSIRASVVTREDGDRHRRFAQEAL